MATFRLTTGNQRIRLNRREVDTVVIESGSRRDRDTVLRFESQDVIDLSAFGDINVQDLIDNAIPRGRRGVILRGDFGRLGLSGITKEQLRRSNFITDTEQILPVDPETGAQYFPGELLIKLTNNDDVVTTQAGGLDELLGAISVEPLFQSGSQGLQSNSVEGQWYVVKFDPNANLDDIRNRLAQDPAVENIEFNYLLSINYVPNDPEYNQLWGLNNTGQTRGTADADIDAPEAWDIQRGSRDVIVAVVDTGVDYNHPDLAENIWTNSGEIPNNGVDDDGNGFIDDFYGWDWVNQDNDPMDGKGHGTHVAGTIGAVGDNNLGVVGVSPNVSIMSLKFLPDRGSGSSANAAKAVVYAVDMGADVINASFGGGPFSQLMVDALEYANDGGVLFVASAGNDGKDIDESLRYPASYDVPNVLSVAATDHNDQIASFSNYGETTVDLGAPGERIWSSSIPRDENNGNRYEFKSGTSMAAPHVAGAAALLLAEDPNLSPTELKNILMTTADPVSSLEGKTVTGGRLNLYNAILEVANNPSPENNPPVAANDAVTIEVETSVTIAVLGNDTDPDGDPLSIFRFATTSEDGGRVTRIGNSLQYTPAFGFTGNDSFRYTINDGNGGTDSAIVDVTVSEAPNQPPVAGNDSATVGFETSAIIDVLANDTDENGDNLSISDFSSTSSEGGTIARSGNRLRYTPADGFSGLDSFRYTITDGNGEIDSATVTITVSEVQNQLPVAVNDFVIMEFERTSILIDVLANDTDSNGDELSSIADFPSRSSQGFQILRMHTNVDSSNFEQRLLYSPALDFAGNDSFRYTISDENGGTDSATVNITVLEAPNQSFAVNDSATVGINSTAKIQRNGREDNDIIIGGVRSDQLTGSEGANEFRYMAVTDSDLTTPDLIKDFNPTGENDTIRLAFLPTSADVSITNVGGSMFNLTVSDTNFSLDIQADSGITPAQILDAIQYGLG